MFQSLDIQSLYESLELTPEASDEQVRASYLKLVQKFPPDRAPERFAEIHRAYKWLTQPLEYAEELVGALKQPPPELKAITADAQHHPPRLKKSQLLSLGNGAP
jgi:curved DNA-binding protein CbpA